MGMSDTPRTDAKALSLPIYGPSDAEFVPAEFARDLERDLTEARARVAEYESYRCEPAVKIDDRPWDVLHKQLRLLQALVNGLESKYGPSNYPEWRE